MQSPLTLHVAVEVLAEEVQQRMLWQLLDENHPYFGSYIPPTSGHDDASHGGSARFVMAAFLLALAQVRHSDSIPAEVPEISVLVERMNLALDYMLRVQRPSGLIDLRSTNYDSSPDTGFIVESFCAIYDLAEGEAILAGPLEKIETFIRRAVAGMLTGGFHTPNHRWVISSALSQAGALFPDLDVKDVVRSYIAEGFDVDEEGAYIEHSVGIYDSVTNRALLLFADHWDNPNDIAAAHTAIDRNLEFDLYLLHADATTETGLSRRQDYGTRYVPITLLPAYLHRAAQSDNPLFARAAQWLWEQAPREDVGHAPWLAWALMRFGPPPQSDAVLPEDYVRFFPKNQIWRARQGKISASAFGGKTQLMTLTYGAVELSNIAIDQTYFGVGHFIAEEMHASGDSVTLHSSGIQKPHKPGYELPLGRRVEPDQWDEIFAERDYRPLPPAESTLEITAVEGGFDLRYRTLQGLDRVAAQIAFDFPAGGFWETADSATPTLPGQVIILKQGWGQLRFGDDAIRIEPGAFAHRMVAMRHSIPAPSSHIRVLLTFETPIDHTIRLRLFSGVNYVG